MAMEARATVDDGVNQDGGTRLTRFVRQQSLEGLMLIFFYIQTTMPP